MGLTIKELGRRLETARIPFRGGMITIRALTAAQRFKIRQLMPAPAPPYMESPEKGGAPIPDTNNAGYRDKARNWSVEVATVDVAFALDLALADGTACPAVTDPGFLSWATKAAAELRENTSDTELARIQEHLAELESGNVRSANADPSSSPAPRAGTTPQCQNATA